MNRRFLAIGAVVTALAAGGSVTGVVLASSDGHKSATGGSASRQPGTIDLHPIAGNFKPDHTKLADCNEQRCYEQAFGNVAYYDGPKAALKLFAQQMAANKAIESGCHRIAHTIGSASLVRFHGDIPKAFSQGSSICWSGYYHGILERAFFGISTQAGLIKAARRVCASPTLQSDQWLLYQCVHGLGHGLMISTGYDLPFALHVCDKLLTSWDQTSCTGGVYMENVNAANGTAYGGKTPWVRSNDLVYPCDAPVTKGHRLYCYLMVTSRVLAANGYDWKATAKICAHVEKIWVSTCFQSYGRDADGSSRQDPVRDRALCKLAGPGERDCLYGAVRDLTANYAGGKQASVLCRQLAAGFKADCYRGIGTILGSLEPDTPGRHAACAAVTPAPFLQACLQGAGV